MIFKEDRMNHLPRVLACLCFACSLKLLEATKNGSITTSKHLKPLLKTIQNTTKHHQKTTKKTVPPIISTTDFSHPPLRRYYQRYTLCHDLQVVGEDELTEEMMLGFRIFESSKIICLVSGFLVTFLCFLLNFDFDGVFNGFYGL